MARREAPGRTAIIAGIRRSLGRGPLSADARRELDDRLRQHKRNLLPKQAQASADERLALFQEKAEAVACTVEHLAGADEVPTAVAAYLRAHNLPSEVALAPASGVTDLPWDSEPMLNLRPGASNGGERVSVTPAFAGVAETGTLIALSGPEHPTTLNFLPEHHLVVLRASQVVAGYEDAWALLRKARKKGRGFTMPRTLNMITGPSCTGDIELTIQHGAHGPRGLHIMLIDDEEAQADG